MKDDLILKRLDVCRDRVLRHRPVRSIAQSIGSLSRKWLDAGYSPRLRAIRRLRESGYPERIARGAVDDFFSELTASKLMGLLRCEIVNPSFLDDFCPDRVSGTLRRARGADRILHIFPANVPTAPILSCVLGLLVKSASIAKTSARNAGFLDLYLQSLKRHDPDLAAAVYLIQKPGQIERFAGRCGLTVAYGNDRTIEHFRTSRAFASTRLIGYGHKVSFGLYFREAFAEGRLEALASKTAWDVSALNQEGCLSPKIFFVERQAGTRRLRRFCELLSASLERLWKTAGPDPKRPDVWTAHRRRTRMHLARLRLGLEAYIKEVPGTDWKIVTDASVNNFAWLDENHVVCLAPFTKFDTVLRRFGAICKHLQAVSVSGVPASGKKSVFGRLSETGFNRICAPGRLQRPPIDWRHDGRPNLEGWLSWTDRESVLE